MNGVVFYSNTGQSAAVAEYFAEKLRYPLFDIGKAEKGSYENLVLVFPVHCQNLPHAVKEFLKNCEAENLTAIATYGKMCCGNVIYEIEKKYCKNVVAGAYIPAKHAYVADDDSFMQFDRLAPVVEKIKNPSKAAIPKLYKNPFADFFPGLRSRIGVKLIRNSDCNGCGVCTKQCDLSAIKSGIPDGKCIRCLKCVEVCPRRALQVKIRLPLKLYLRKKKQDRLIVYV